MSVNSEDTTEQKNADSSLVEDHQELFERAKRASTKLNKGDFSSWKETSQKSLSEQLINMLAPIQREGLESTSEELSALNRLTSAIAESVDQGIISEEEAENLLKHALSNFIDKRMEEVVNGLFSESRSKWFLAASHRYYEREE